MKLRTTALLCVGLAACGGSEPPPAPPPVPVFGAQSGYPRVAAEVVDWYLSRHPVRATTSGEHAYDTTLGSYFPGQLENAKRDARALLTRLDAVHRPTLERPDYFDHRLLEYGLRAELLDLEEIGGWQRDPVRYVRLVGSGTAALMRDDGLDLEGRLASMASRWHSVPQLFRAARQNLDASRVPPVYVRQAVGEARTAIAWLEEGVESDLAPRGLASMPPARRAEWDAARRLAVASIDSFAVWLERDLGPRAIGDFRLGPANLAAFLKYRYHQDIPVSELFEINSQAALEHVDWLERVALEVDPLLHPRDMMSRLIAENPEAMQLFPAMDAHWAPPASRVRRAFWSDAMPFGVIHYFELAALESEAASDIDRLIGIRRALHAHALLHGMIMLHAADGTIDEVAEQIARMALIDREQAREEAEEIAHDPAVGLIALERMQIFALRERLRATRGDYADRAFVDELVELGLPVPLAAEAMLGHEPGPLLAVGRRTPGVPEPPRLLD